MHIYIYTYIYIYIHVRFALACAAVKRRAAASPGAPRIHVFVDMHTIRPRLRAKNMLKHLPAKLLDDALASQDARRCKNHAFYNTQRGLFRAATAIFKCFCSFG